MDISINKSNECTIIDLKGRLDTTNFMNLENELNTLIDKGTQNLILDCENLDYVSSSGLRVFLVALKKIKKLNGKFLMCNLQETIQEIFEISGFITIFEIHETRQAALNTCKL